MILIYVGSGVTLPDCGTLFPTSAWLLPPASRTQFHMTPSLTLTQIRLFDDNLDQDHIRNRYEKIAKYPRIVSAFENYGESEFPLSSGKGGSIRYTHPPDGPKST